MPLSDHIRIFTHTLFRCHIFLRISILFHLSIWRYEAWLCVKDMNQLLNVCLNRKDIPAQVTQVSKIFGVFIYLLEHHAAPKHCVEGEVDLGMWVGCLYIGPRCPGGMFLNSSRARA